MKSFNEIIETVLKHEGGYVDDPYDKGGQTNYGISKRAHPDVDIKRLTRQQAKQIYYDHYWIPSRAQELPERLRGPYFDMVVNHGQQNAVRILQQACNGRPGIQIAQDGLIGPQTIGASRKLEKKRLISYRVLFFAHIIENNETQERFWYGWFRRSISSL